jgi:hypothetical protein
MTPLRASTFAFAFVALAALGCRAESRDSLPGYDETGENEDCPGCFDPAYMLWDLQAALHEGALHPVVTAQGERPAQLTVVLVDYDYQKAVDAGEEPDPFSDEYSCTLIYTPSLAEVGTPQGSWFAWSLALEPVQDNCGELDPDWIQSGFYDALPGLGVAMIGAALDEGMEANLAEAFGDQATWETEGAPYYFGLTGTIDGMEVYGEGQSHYGRAYQIEPVEGGLGIKDEGSGGVLLTVEEIEAGQSGWLETFAWSFFTPRDQLR